MSALLSINVNEHTEKKNGLTYLSWAWAWAEVLKIDPAAKWEAHEWNGLPAMFLPNGTAMVKVSVTIKGDTKTCPLPVMDHRNKAIPNPDSFAINTATMRALAKAISMHGLGLYIYAGEDLPEDAPREDQPKPKKAGDSGSPTAILFDSLSPDWQQYILSLATLIENTFASAGPKAAQAELDNAVQADQLDGTHIGALYSKLGSKTRAQLKALKEAA